MDNKILRELYIKQKWPVSRIAKKYKCSENKINYWLKKYSITKRTISDAIYDFHNPLGDPFLARKPRTLEDGILFGMGLGLYWGEGSKRGNGGVRLANTDVRLVRKFIEFLEKMFKIKRSKLRFSIQIFSDISPRKAFDYWRKELKVSGDQFYKTMVLKVRGEGTYKYKSEYGVIIVCFNNVKLKRLLCSMIENIR
jgi:hypothetical protein